MVQLCMKPIASTVASMVIVPQTAKENPDAENVRENTTQTSVIVQQFNAYIAKLI
jgi:hypothetical protein